MFAAHATAIGQSGFAAFAGVAVQETVLPFAANFRWLILAFHLFSIQLSRSANGWLTSRAFSAREARR
jgi:hypothetical protein